jgi:16S rRNA (cytosine967-C5)-methyltransferase
MKLTPAMIRELQREPRLWLRARPGTGAEFAAKLGACEQHRVLTDAIWFKGSDDLYQTPEFRNGEFEIQDLSSQAVGILCDPQPAQIWWDACAGEGGKTLHLCDLMRNKGLVWASDPAEWRLKIMKRRAARANLFNYRVKTWQNPSHLPIRTKLDGILIDAPCSGIGTWGRNPHARWTTSPETVAELAKVQSGLLAKTAALLKPGGKLVYSVCTLAEAETTIVADLFETTHREFQPAALANPLAPEERSSRFTIQPQAAHANGMFIAAWTRAGK